MKIHLTLLCSLVIAASAFAQTPEKMTFQSVVRNADGQLVKSKTVGVKITLLQGSSTGNAVYSETYSLPTNSNGLLTLEIGNGTPITGVFSAIDWASGPYFIQTEADPDGGASYTVSGVSALNSVPYALHANTAQTLSGGENDPLFSVSVAAGITAVDTAYWNDHTTSFQIDSIDIVNLGFVAGAHTDEQTLSLTGSNLSISNGNSVDISSIDTQIDSIGIDALGFVAGPHTIDTDDQTLSLTGTTLSIDGGNSVNLSSIDTDTQIDSAGVAAFGFVAEVNNQFLSLTGTMLEISGGNTLNLASIDTDTDTDDQTLSLSGPTLSIADGNSVNLAAISSDTQNLSLSGSNLIISGGNSVDLASLAGTDTDDQTLSLSGTTLSIADGNSVNLSSISSDTQSLSISGSLLNISGGNSVDLSSLAGTDTDDQTLSLSGTTLSIADGNSVSLSSINTDTQNLSLSGSSLSISSGNSIDLASIDTDTDDQTLSLSGSTLSIADGNSVNLPAVVAGSNKQITFNDNDSVGADAELVYDKTTNQMGIGTSTVNSGAALEVSSTTGGILLPRLTTAQRDALTPKVGTMVFNADSGRFQGYSGFDESVNAQHEDPSFLGSLSLAGQSFTATSDGLWTVLVVRFQSAATGTLNIYAGNGVSGSPIYSQSFNVGAGQQEITLTTPIQITANQQYTFSTGAVCDYYPFSTYAGGTSYTSTFSFSGNLWFKVYTGAAQWVDLH